MENQQKSRLGQVLGKTGSLIWWASGGKLIASSLKHAGNQADRSLGRFQTLFGVLQEKLQKRPQREETFKEAVIIHQLTPLVLAEKRRQCLQMLRLVTPLFPIALFYCVYHLVYGHYFAVFVGFASLALAGAVIFRNAFLIWQIDKRYLGTPMEFIQSGEWMPGSVIGEQEE